MRRVALLLLAVAAPAAAQTIPGYTPAAATRERQVEADAIRLPDSARARVHSRALAARPHVAGTDAQATTRDYVIAQMKAMGLETEVRAYDIWMPHPTRAAVWRVSPDTLALPLDEPPVAGDEWSKLPQ